MMGGMAERTNWLAVAALGALVGGLWLAEEVRGVGDPNIIDVAAQGNRGLLDDGPTRSWGGERASVHTSERGFTETVRVTADDVGRTIDPLDVECHGGVAEVGWYVGNLEPVKPSTGIHLSLRMDGDVISSALVGSTDGVYNDQPAEVRAVLDCPAGPHRFDLLIEQVTGGWGIPYVQNTDDDHGGLVVRRGLTVWETF